MMKIGSIKKKSKDSEVSEKEFSLGEGQGAKWHHLLTYCLFLIWQGGGDKVPQTRFAKTMQIHCS